MIVERILVIIARKVTKKQHWKIRFLNVGSQLPLLEYSQIILSITAEMHSGAMFQSKLIMMYSPNPFPAYCPHYNILNPPIQDDFFIIKKEIRTLYYLDIAIHIFFFYHNLPIYLFFQFLNMTDNPNKFVTLA